MSVPALNGSHYEPRCGHRKFRLVVSFGRDNLMRGMDPVAAALDAGENRIAPC